MLRVTRKKSHSRNACQCRMSLSNQKDFYPKNVSMLKEVLVGAFNLIKKNTHHHFHVLMQF